MLNNDYLKYFGMSNPVDLGLRGDEPVVLSIGEMSGPQHVLFGDAGGFVKGDSILGGWDLDDSGPINPMPTTTTDDSILADDADMGGHYGFKVISVIAHFSSMASYWNQRSRGWVEPMTKAEFIDAIDHAERMDVWCCMMANIASDVLDTMPPPPPVDWMDLDY